MTIIANDDDLDYVIIYGYEKAYPNHTAYLRLGSAKEPSIYYVEESEENATHFKLNKRGWTPAKICKFLKDEDDLRGWQFHTIIKHKH